MSYYIVDMPNKIGLTEMSHIMWDFYQEVIEARKREPTNPMSLSDTDQTTRPKQVTPRSRALSPIHKLRSCQQRGPAEPVQCL